MPRPLRAFRDGIFHLTAHASDLRYLFLNDEDRKDFLGRLAAVCRRFDLGLLSYVLMGNHYHVIVRIPDARVSAALQLLHTEYSRHHNRRHERSAVSGVGHLGPPRAQRAESARDPPRNRLCRFRRCGVLEKEPSPGFWGTPRSEAALLLPR